MNKKVFISDLLAGLSVSFAALALGAAFGVMSGRGAFAGMIAAAVIPIITGLFGGTRLSVSGPTGPMTAVSAVVIAFAYDKFSGDRVLAEQFITLIFLLMSVLLIVLAIFKTGKLIRYVPQVIILGFMSGIAMVIWVDQIKVLFGIGGKKAPQGDFSTNLILVIVTFFTILLLPKLLKKLKVPKSVRLFIPSTLTAIILMTVITVAFNINVGRVNLGVTMSSFSEFFTLIASYFPSQSILTQEYLLLALPYALQLTLLCYLDSLLTALIMDHLTKEKSNMNKELVGQGLSNGLAAFFMGIPGAQATIRSVLLFKEGAKTRLGAVMAGFFALISLLFFKDYVSLIASAVFIGVLIKAALDVFEKEFIIAYLKRKWHRSKERNIQLGFILATMLITAFIDLNIAVIGGTILFYIGKKYLKYNDVSADFADEEAEKDVEQGAA